MGLAQRPVRITGAGRRHRELGLPGRQVFRFQVSFLQQPALTLREAIKISNASS